MSDRDAPVIRIDTDRPCSKCGKVGATAESGICLTCITERLTGRSRRRRGGEEKKRMGKTYETADRDTVALVAKVMEEHHPTLDQADVSIGTLFVAKESKEGDAQPALRHRGFPVAAQIQITSLADRVHGVADAKLTIDRFVWDRLPEASRLALIDHELAHLIVLDDEGTPQRDDIGRPKLRIRPHDYELTGFTDVAERHGEASMEVRALRAFRHEQLPLFCPDGLG